MEGVCYDENYNDDSLTNAEVHTAMKNAFASTGRTEKLTWVGYDACLMAVADIANYNADYFNYMISSQESEPGEGWDYDTWLSKIIANPEITPLSLATNITDTYIQKCADTYNSYGGNYRGFNDGTMSVLDLSKMSAFSTAFEKMAGQISTVVTSSSKWSTLKTLMNSCQRFGAATVNNQTVYQFDIFDIQDFCEKIAASSTYKTTVTAVSEMKTALTDLVAYNKYGNDSSDACGLCMFCPVSGYSYSYGYASGETGFTTWQTFVKKYGSFYK